MTVSTEVDHNDYTGNGVTTSFPYTFRIFKKSDLTVQVADLNENITVLTLDTDYSVTGAGTYSGGNVVLMSPLANGWQISISRDLPVTQETDLRNQGKFFAEVHEDAFDKLTMLIQQCFSFLRLSLRKPSFIATYYDALNNRIRNLRDPSQAQDAATKNYVDGQIVDNTNAWKAGDAILDQKIDSNFARTLRVPESTVDQLSPVSVRKNSLLGWDSNGKPIPVFTMTDTADLAVKLASQSYGLGAYLVGWARNYSCEVAANVAVFLSAQKINLWEYQHLCVPKAGDPTTLDWGPALLKALKDGARNRKVVYAPGLDGGYYISKLGEILTNLDTSGAESLMSVYALVGDGANQTRFYSDTADVPVMEFRTCRIMWKGWSLSGPGDTAYAGIKLGEASTISAVRLSYIEDIKVGWFSNPVMIGHAWDSTFVNLHIQNWGRNSVYIQERTNDNTNNLTFIHLHLEPTLYNGGDTCRGFVCMGGTTANTKNHSIRLIQPHIEPRNWNCQHFYISNCVGVLVDSPSVNRNNDISGIANANIAPAVHIISSVGVHFRGGQIIHIGTRADDVAPIIKVEGIVKSIKFDGYIDTGRASVANFAGGIDLSNSPNATREVLFDGAPVGSFTSFSSVRNFWQLSVLANMQRTVSGVAEQYSIAGTTDTGTVLKFLMGNTADPSTAPTEIMRMYSEGYLYNKGYVSPTVTIAAGATYTHIVGAGVNNRRGEYKITGLEDDNTLFGSFFNVPNKAPKPTGIIGDGINLSQAQPDSSVTNKLCIYQSGQYIVLENRRSASVTLAIRFDSGIS
ncbi:phage tail protein [Klebsiella quasipneumoniae]|uniref:phage tail protein n=1 Tax=Klebsiella quasipneumoniae TaxID=1463165 RepID=UPI001CFBC2A3|nr:phage tail protein [Klebsiella quasipneumoniae]MCB4709637.1 phage tail protein [Klebsiella quasipneumoniae]